MLMTNSDELLCAPNGGGLDGWMETLIQGVSAQWYEADSRDRRCVFDPTRSFLRNKAWRSWVKIFAPDRDYARRWLRVQVL